MLLISADVLAQYTTPVSFWLSPQFTAPTAMSAYDYPQISAHYQKQALVGNIGARSMILSGQMPLSNGRNAQFGTVGVNLMRQETGTAYLFSTTGALLSYNYTVRLTSRHHLIGGVQGGYFSRSIDWAKVTTSNQFSNGEINPGLDHGENFNDYQSRAFTTNVGLAYYLADARGEQKFHIGAGMINANKGRFTYLENDDNQAEPVRWIVYSHLRLVSSPFFELGTNMYWQQESKLNDFVGGLQLNKGINPRKTVSEEHLGLGLYYSPDKTTTLAMQLKRQNLLLGISYSMPLGNQALHGIQNAAEVTLGWHMQKAARKRSYNGGSYRGKIPGYSAKTNAPRKAGKKAPAYKYKAKRNAAQAYGAKANKRKASVRTKNFSKKVSSYKAKANKKKPTYKNRKNSKSIFSGKYKRAQKPTFKAKKIKRRRPGDNWFKRLIGR